MDDDRTMVGERIDLEESNGTFRFTVDNLPRAGGGTTVTGQRRRMDVDNTMVGNFDHFGSKKRWAVGDNQAKVGGKGPKLIDKVLIKSFRLKEGERAGAAKVGNGVGKNFLVAAEGFVGLGDNGRKLKFGVLEEGMKNREGVGRGGKENNFGHN